MPARLRRRKGDEGDPEVRSILTINGGSSSIRFAVYGVSDALRRRLCGKIDRIGASGTNLVVNGPDGTPLPRLAAADHRTAAGILVDRLEAQPVFASVVAVGHRLVHGMQHSEPERVTPTLLAELRWIAPYDPDHLRREIGLIRVFSPRHPTRPQVACFDTAFHHGMPPVAKRMPIQRRYAAKGVERYGFHGLSYAYLMAELGHLDPAAGTGRVILAHLGNGASLAAAHHGKSIDTSMGFTPASGLVMSTRTGDLDPGLAYYESGLLGVSGTSADVRDLLARESGDPRAAEAVALFCYQAKKWIGAFAAALGGVDTLVFAGGIGENAPLIRAPICDGFGFLGVALYPNRNAKSAPLISPVTGRVQVRVIRTDEDFMITSAVVRVLDLQFSFPDGPSHGTRSPRSC